MCATYLTHLIVLDIIRVTYSSYEMYVTVSTLVYFNKIKNSINYGQTDDI
jgi:hypothetical protein